MFPFCSCWDIQGGPPVIPFPSLSSELVEKENQSKEDGDQGLSGLLTIDETDNGECGLSPWAGGLPEADLSAGLGIDPLRVQSRTLAPK